MTATYEPKPVARWTLPVVVVLALVGAALVYFELRNIGPSKVVEGRRKPNHHFAATNAPNPTEHTAPLPGPSSSAPVDAGAGGAADAGDDAGDAATAEPPPKGMVFIPDKQGGFFLDRREVSTGDYRRCVMASRCLPATRIALTPDAAHALNIVPDSDTTTTPEQLATAWQPRCNELRHQTDQPVNCVSHVEASDYCRFVDKRLPTSAEWDRAARGDGRRFPWGNVQPECKSACYGLNGSCVGSASQVATCPAGSHAQDTTPEGVVDLAGNVSEWVSDAAAKKDPHGPPWRLLRGGSFVDEANELMASRPVPPATAHVTIGFRCAEDAPDGYVPPAADAGASP